MKQPVLILTVGLPYSGKTTWVKAQGLPIVSPDAIRVALHGHRFIPEAEMMVWGMAHWMTASLFAAGHDRVILDAVNNSQRRRSSWKDPRWRREYHVLETSGTECIARAQEAGDAEIIPIIERMQAQWEPVQPEEWDREAVGL